MVDWRSTASRVRNSLSSRQEFRSHPVHTIPYNQHQQHNDANEAQSEIIQSYIASNSNNQQNQQNLPSSSSTRPETNPSTSSVSPVPGAFYIPNSLAQRASANMPPEDGAALRKQLAFDALALVRELPCTVRGWVFVKRDVSRISSIFRQAWVPFWGELRGGMLLFYDPNPDYVQEQRQIRLVFTATNCIIDLKNASQYSQVKLRRNDGQFMIMRVSNPQEAQQWCVALQTNTFQYTTIRLADFDWITAIGKGASGKVFLVRDNRTNARLALKVIDKSRVFRTQLTFQHVINERLVLEMCSGCPFLIQLRYAFQTDSHLYFATDFYDGGDVFSLLQSNRGRLSEKHARRIFAEIVLALSWLHERNIAYRDLKPENVVLDGEGHVRLADFGLAKVLKLEHNFLTQTICGTTAYAAPEMLRSTPYNVSLDLWCLGVFIFHVLTGRPPFNFKGRTMEEMEQMQRTKRIHYSSSLSLEAVSLIKGLLRTDPFERYTLEEVKKHPFFRSVDWVRVAQKEPHPDDVSRLVGDKEQRGPEVARLAIARAQQLGHDSDSAATLPRTEVQEISSLTLDRYLLRNINPDEWRHVSFSDDDDMSATAEFPAFIHKKGTEMETWAIAGWAYTCSEASGRSSRPENGATGFRLADFATTSQINVAHGRRSLPVWGHPNSNEPIYQRSQENDRPFFQQRASLQDQPGFTRFESQGERGSQPIQNILTQAYEYPNVSQPMIRQSVSARPTSEPQSVLPTLSVPPTPESSNLQLNVRKSAKSKLNFGRIGNSIREGKTRGSVEMILRTRKSSDARSRRSNETPEALPRSFDKRQVRSQLEPDQQQQVN